MPRPPRPTLFPYTTLFRSYADHRYRQAADRTHLHGQTSFVPAIRAVSSTFRDASYRTVANSAGERCRWGSETGSEEHTSELQSRLHLVCRLLLEKKKYKMS